MGEYNKHIELKKKAVNMLINLGFSKEEIKEEYRWDGYIIDMAGINEQKKVFIECGIINISKLNKLKNNQEITFMHLPYPKPSYKGKFMLDIPEELHDKLRHRSIDEKKDINDIILEAIKKNG